MSRSPSSSLAQRICADADRDGCQACADQRQSHDVVHILYEEHSPELVRRLRRRTGCVELAREVANETFLKLLKLGPAKLQTIEQPEAYLWRVSSNLLRDLWRARALTNETLAEQWHHPEQVIDQVAALESRDTLRRLEQAVDRLKPKTREIFLAHRLEGLTYAQIAERKGLSVKGVEKHMSKAIAKIDRLLDRN